MKLLEIIEEHAGAISPQRLKKELKREGIKVRRKRSENKLVKFLRNLEFKQAAFITDKGFAGEYLSRCGVENIFKISREDLENVREAKLFFHRCRAKIVVGFGGGRALDVAKKVAYDTQRKLVLIPTAPSHNGIISPTASLYEGEKKKSFPCKYPELVVIPFPLWFRAERHIFSGIMDVLGTITAVEDVFLANVLKGEEIKTRELEFALTSVKYITRAKRLKDIERALLCAGLAMKTSSRYCSGCEHESEKALSKELSEFMHGELVGVCTLICAYIYSQKVREKNLIFPPGSLFSEIFELYKTCGVLSRAKEILSSQAFIEKAPDLLKKSSKIRPERFTLWNVVNSEEIDYREIIKNLLQKEA